MYCTGSLLSTIQLSGIFNDSKTFVDMPMKQDYSPEDVLESFQYLNNKEDPDVLTQFVVDHFDSAGSDVKEWIPEDYTESPSLLASIRNLEYVSWAKDINALWLSLGRQLDESVIARPEQHSLLVRKHPFIVPGGRFRETYYWDSWFIMKGLLACDMTTTSKYLILNLLEDVNNYGFVPNGARIYYLDRSQPPVLSEMVMEYYEHCTKTIMQSEEKDELIQFIRSSYTSLKKEYAFWMEEKENGHVTTVSTSSGNFKLNRYSSTAASPRPESYREDYTTAAHANSSNVYTNIRAGAESGWDFSSRWIRRAIPGDKEGEDVYDLAHIQTMEIVPVDLNSILYRFEGNLKHLAGILHHSYPDQQFEQDVMKYAELQEKRAQAMRAVLWDSETSCYKDFNITSHSYSDIVTASSYFPMWAGLIAREDTEKSLLSLQQSNLLQKAGVLTTTVHNSFQQWDAPNAWAPIVMIIIMGLRTLDTEPSRALAHEIKQQWLQTGYMAYQRDGYMYEKYDAYVVGKGGGGGEYEPQIGFGWTNGVVLALLREEEPV